MQFESLKIFCDVVRHRSFSRAAEVNHLTQSAASQVVHQLERRLEVQLIDRTTRPLQLTAVGQVYYQGCQGLVDNYLELEAKIKKSNADLESSVDVAAIYSVGLGDMGQIVERFKALQPHARVHLEYLHPDRVYEKVLEGSADFGLVSFPRKARHLSVLPWRQEPMVLACAPSHPLAGHKSVRAAQLDRLAYVGFDKNLVIRREVDRFLRDRDVVVEVVHEFDNIENIKKAVEIAAGVALLPEPTLRREVEEGTLVAVPLAGARLQRPLGIIHHRQRKLGWAARDFIDLLRHSEPATTNGRHNGRLAHSGADASEKNGANRAATRRKSPGRNS